MEQVHLFITGFVQGVFFRAESREKALSLGLTGWAKNTHEGGVEIIAQGPREKLEEFIQWCRFGPKAADVKKVEIQWDNKKEDFKVFEIRFS